MTIAQCALAVALAVALNSAGLFPVASGAELEEGYRAQCGDVWQEQYTALHRSMIAAQNASEQGAGQGKFVIVKCNCGLADAMYHVNFAFIYALLSGRALILHEMNYFSEVYDSPNVDWWQPELAEQLIQEGAVVLHRHGEGYNTSIAFPNGTKDHTDYAKLYLSADVPVWLDGEKTVVFTPGIGGPAANYIFRNMNALGQLHTMGLEFYNFERCIIDYLFNPKRAVYEAFQQELEFFEGSPAAGRVIALHIRTDKDFLSRGMQPKAPPIQVENHMLSQDAALMGQGGWYTADDFLQYFQCAEQIEQRLVGTAMAAQPLRWYLVSDSLSVRRSAKEKYGDKLFTRADVSLGHVTMHSDAGKQMAAVAEFFFLSRADFHVFGASGFGTLGASHGRKPWPHGFYIRGKNASDVDCGNGMDTSMQRLATGMHEVRV